ncbi:CheR family methyltransferase [Undibacterium squillarum]|uniref:Chemotaxis protein methyltransferase n=1 Tax=Undibacterium squillarum TaxID=1131567 RepID=A0ABQ2Y0G7_9BURK|nr:CheR family methyltransferase [Undibacterium squillarum]GGX47123.1 chemotaxis protein methyltransferase [Undibacterium squillarum]
MRAENLRGKPVLELSAQEFDWICRFLYERTGIALKDGKQAMVMGRLENRLRRLQLAHYQQYFSLLGRPGYEEETRLALDLLTTNETYFFREPRHFEFLREVIDGIRGNSSFRIWSAASSSGEEAYTAAMVIADQGRLSRWEITGTDISERMLEKARLGLYPMQAAEKIPPAMLKRFCLRGKEEYEDFFMIDPVLRQRVNFLSVNLIQPLPPSLGEFDLIFLRNVMIYFDLPTKQKLLRHMLPHLKPGGYLLVSHSETLNGVSNELKMLFPSVYQREI